MRVNEHIARMPAQYLFADIARRVSAYAGEHPEKRLIRMGIGDVTRPLSPAVARAFADAALGMASSDGFFGYAPDGGYPFLIKAILENDYLSRGIDLDPDEVFVSDGAKSDTGALQELFAADALIGVTDPVYPVYVDANAFAGRLGEWKNGAWSRLVTLPCTYENDFVPELPDKRVDVLYLCSPNNPTGTVLPLHRLQRFVDWAKENDTLIIYDAAYKAFIHDPALPASIYECKGARDVAIECCSFSKTAGFTGVRCAYTVIPKAVSGRLLNGEKVSINAMWKRRVASKFNGVSYPVQRAAEAVYSDQGWRENMETIAYYRENARLLLEALCETGLRPRGGVNAPYIWMQAPQGMSGWAFFDFLLSNAGVVGTPGEGFGSAGAGCFRLTAFGSRENTVEAAQRIRQAVESL